MTTETKPTPQLTLHFITRNTKTERLYRLEEQRRDLMRQVAEEYARLLGYPEAEFYTRTIPEVLMGVLDQYAPSTSVPAAKRYLEIYENKT